jgi:hypothetical protein
MIPFLLIKYGLLFSDNDKQHICTYVSRSVHVTVAIMSSVHVDMDTSEARNRAEKEDVLKHCRRRMLMFVQNGLCQPNYLHIYTITTHSHVAKNADIRVYLTEYNQIDLQA